MHEARRRLLKGAGASVVASLFPHAALSQTNALVAAPRRALVVGNNRYRDEPLRNPVNDANAIAAELRNAGFQVTLALDAGLAQMRAAVDAFGQELSRSKAVGLFYFAGHGVQLAWRNYLLPVDTAIDALEEVKDKAVDLGHLLDNMGRAGNPANLLILDACRNNPFGRDFRVEQKGLSQVDAPVGTLLAYATAPGNVALDGEGVNGLYTEHLLRELRVQDAKVEDAFKRVRLGVRRRSNGQQIPWESTSLEDDFYFLPPKELKRLAEAEKRRNHEAQLSEWERLRESRDLAAIEQFLRRDPSGPFAELAQLKLDRLLAQQGERRVEIASQAANPYTKGSARADTRFKIGDSYTIRTIDYFTKIESSRVTETVTAITDDEVIFNGGSHVLDLLGNPIKHRDGRQFTPMQQQVTEYSVGRKWSTRFYATVPGSPRIEFELSYKVVGKERVTVPAGTFECFKVETFGGAFGIPFSVRGGYWISPGQVKRLVAIESVRTRRGQIIASDRDELVAFREAS